MLILCYDNDPVCEEFTMTLSDDSYTMCFQFLCHLMAR
jgi:hypothetical protein